MERTVARKLETAVRVRDFVRAHPFPDPTHAALAARLDEAVVRAQALAVREQTGRLDAAAAARHRRALRRGLHRELLRYVAGVGEAAARESPELAGRFRAPSKDLRNASFLAGARDLLEAARAHQDRLAAYGLAPSQVEDLAGALTRYEAVTEQANAGRRDHVGARAELLSVVAGLMRLTRLLDTLNRMRFRDEPDLLAAWESARSVAGAGKSRSEEPGPDTEPPASPEHRALGQAA